MLNILIHGRNRISMINSGRKQTTIDVGHRCTKTYAVMISKPRTPAQTIMQIFYNNIMLSSVALFRFLHPKQCKTPVTFTRSSPDPGDIITINTREYKILIKNTHTNLKMKLLIYKTLFKPIWDLWTSAMRNRYKTNP